MEYRIINLDGDVVKTVSSDEYIDELLSNTSSYHLDLKNSGSTEESYFWYPIDTLQLESIKSGSINRNGDVFFILNEIHWDIYQSSES